MGMIEPCRARIVEVGKGTLRQFLGRCIIHRHNADGISGHDFGFAADQFERIQPIFAEFVQPCGGDGNRLCAGIVGIVGGGNVRRQPFWKGKGREG